MMVMGIGSRYHQYLLPYITYLYSTYCTEGLECRYIPMEFSNTLKMHFNLAITKGAKKSLNFFAFHSSLPDYNENYKLTLG